MNDEKNLFDYYSIQEITANFSLDELLTFAKQKNLGEWLESNFYTAESKQIYEATENKLDDSKLKLLICKIFNFGLDKLSTDEIEEVSEIVAAN